MKKEKLLERVLDAKEERADYQKILINKYKLPIVSLTLNLPGGYFEYDRWEKVLEKACQAIDSVFAKNIVFRKIRLGKWGAEGFWAIDLPIKTVKKEAMEIEDTHPLGRLFDIDVIDIDGLSISRRNFNKEPRKCIICNNNAIDCYILKKHTLEELIFKVKNIINEGLKLNENQK